MSDTLRVSNIHFGNAASNYNQPQMGYTSVGIGSTTNYGFLQFFGMPNTLCWTANGMVGIGTTNPGAPLYLFAASTGLPNGIMSVFSSSILSSTASSYDILQRWYESSSNASFVDLMWVRGSTGSNWETTSQRFQAKTDGTWQSFIEFNGPNNNYGVTIGTGSSTSNPNNVPGVLYVKQGGLVGIGMTNPATTLHITQSLGITSYYSTFGTASAMPAQLILESPTTHRLYMGSYYTPGQSELSVIQSSAYFSSTDHAGVLLLNPNGGTVGIGGTNIPGYTLDVSGSSSALGLSATRSTAGISGSGRISYYNGTNSVLYWLLGSISSSVSAYGGSIDINGDLVRIDTALKNVQFGCSVNYGNFTVNRSSASGTTGTVNGNIVVYRNTTTSFYDVYLVFASASSFVGDVIYSNASFMYLTPNFVAAPSASGTYLLAWDHSVNTYMAITNSGQVGIGTAAPRAPLHVYDALGVSLSNAATVNYTQSAILGFNFGGGTEVGTRDSFRILSQTVNRDNGAGPTFFDYGAQADLVFQRKTNNLYSGGANDMTYTEVMRIGGATGNVGIGTNDPIYRLQIEQGFGNNSNGLFISNTNYGSMQGLNISMVNAGSGNFNSYAVLQGYTSGVAAGSTPICLQPSSGNVGIGTWNPLTKLQLNETPVNGDVTRREMFRGVREGTVTVQNSVSMAFALGASTSAVSPFGVLDIKLNGFPGLSNNYGSIPDVTVMSVIGNGMVGIGITNPTTTLHVVGSNSIGTPAVVSFVNNGGGQNVTGSDIVNSQITMGSFGPYIRSVQRNAAYTDGIRLDLCTNLGSNDSTPIPRISILSGIYGGSVGIGTTNPGAPLHVVGSGGVGNPLRLVSNSAGSEVGIGFYRNPDQSVPATGDLWVAGVTAWSVGDRNFGIGCNGTTSILNIISSGTIYFSRYTTDGTLSVTSGAGLVSSSSDRRIKENIIYLTDTQQGLASVLNLKPATFSLIGSSGTYLGFIAQDLEQEIPLAVDGKKYEWQWEEEDGKPKFDANGDIVYKLDADGNRMIRPRGLQDRAIIATQTLAIQELAKQNAELTQKLDSLLAWAQAQGFSS